MRILWAAFCEWSERRKLALTLSTNTFSGALHEVFDSVTTSRPVLGCRMIDHCTNTALNSKMDGVRGDVKRMEDGGYGYRMVSMVIIM